MNGVRKIQLLAFLAALTGAAGCSTIDRIGGKMDMAVNHVSEETKPEFEGRLNGIKREGAMTALQVSGRMFDVVEASPGLKNGDIVRIYNTEKGLVARLWKESKDNPRISETIAPVNHSRLSN